MKKIISEKFCLIFAGSALLVIGCSKSSSSPRTKSDILATSVWKYSSAGIDQDADGKIDITLPAGTVETCITDNTLTFKSDKTGIIDEGTTKCDATSAQTSTFTWTLTENDTKLTLSTPILTGFGNDAKVIEISETRLALSKTVAISGFPIPLPVVVVLIH